MQQMANFWENSTEVTEAQFDQFAASTLSFNSYCLRIVAVDADAKVRWVYPVEPNRSLVGFDIRTHPEGYEAIARARATHRAALSAPLVLVGGAKGFAVTAPIFRGADFAGAVVCSLRVEDFFNALVVPEVVKRYGETVTDSGSVLFESEGAVVAASNIRSTDRVEIAGRVWSVSVAPLPAVVSARLGSGRAALWTLGSLVALLAGLGVAIATERALATHRRLRDQGAAFDETRGRLDKAMQQLIQAEKMSAIGELVSGVAHEINNPLASILGYTQLALRHDTSAPVRKYIETAAAEAERAGRIVRNLLTFSRKHAPQKRNVDLNEVVTKALALKVYHFRAGRIALVEDLESGLPRTLLDAHQIQQIVLNLLNNAEHAVAELSGERTIRVATRKDDGRLQLTVSDNGPGVPSDLRERVFEPFFTTKGEEKGTGLGLSICKGIVDQHSGAIRVEGEPGRGATFVIEFPIVIGRRATDNDEAPRPSQPVPTLRILIVDDEPSVRSVLVDLLESKGHTVETAADVPEAQERIAAGEFDAIVSDMKMPHGSGRDVYAAALSKSTDLEKRIVFTTGDGSSAETQRFLRETGATVLLKPFSLHEIEDAIARLVRPVEVGKLR
jgi:signal transduction histidine kinase/ActR/RegA family two-component response regulator